MVAYDSRAIRASLGHMGTVLSAIRQHWASLSTAMRAVTAAAAALAFGAVVWLVEQLATNAFVGAVNEWLVVQVGPLLPGFWQVVATHLTSIIAAAGMVWMFLSWGYWLGQRYPAPPGGASANGSDQIAREQDQRASEQEKTRHRTALGAAKQTLEKLEGLERVVARQYASEKEKTRLRLLQEYRPEIEANIVLISRAAFVTPKIGALDAWEAVALLKWLQEVLPYMERGLFSEAKVRGAEIALRLEEVIASERPKKA